MNVETTRFGTVEIEDDRVITFPNGLLGFAAYRRFCLLRPNDDGVFFWLQSLEEPSLAFVVTDPSVFVPDYVVPIRPEQMQSLGLRSIDDAQVLVIVNKQDDHLTGNLQGPVIVSTISRLGEQLVLAEKRWTTRHTLVELSQVPQAASA
ncbi:MAG: flagellar assembly protein FliW [Phycisphaerales bacterium]|nr:flagellar assembly protein FliW [Phycisphaerales bacterium]